MEVRGLVHIPATLPAGKNSGTHHVEGWVQPTASMHVFQEDEHLLLLPVSSNP
jgi:hypothetical protein